MIKKILSYFDWESGLFTTAILIGLVLLAFVLYAFPIVFKLFLLLCFIHLVIWSIRR